MGRDHCRRLRNPPGGFVQTVASQRPRLTEHSENTPPTLANYLWPLESGCTAILQPPRPAAVSALRHESGTDGGFHPPARAPAQANRTHSSHTLTALEPMTLEPAALIAFLSTRSTLKLLDPAGVTFPQAIHSAGFRLILDILLGDSWIADRNMSLRRALSSSLIRADTRSRCAFLSASLSSKCVVQSSNCCP